MSHVNGSRPYSRAEYLSDAAIHVLGIGFALIAGPALVAIAAIRIGDATTVTALTIYALTLLAMLTCSALYNMIRVPQWADRLRRLDQSAIYLKIAGTYTPFVILFPGSPGFLAGIWAVAIAGASMIVFSAKRRFIQVASPSCSGTACRSTTPSGTSSFWPRPASVTRPSRWRSWGPFPRR
jgi:hemolysin III